MKVKAFYEAYWHKDTAPSEGDPTTATRMAHLDAALQAMTRSAQRESFHVLDAGCGSGEFTAFLQSLGVWVIGFMLSEAAVKKRRLNLDSRELTAHPLVRVARLVLGSCVVSSNGRY
jgi:2-polyprenyl-3-methyl-5-hydroxy-6-metoxy-1,4-benzoquinol methylase